MHNRWTGMSTLLGFTFAPKRNSREFRYVFESEHSRPFTGAQRIRDHSR